MHVERKPGELRHGLDHLSPEGEVGHEAAVHDVDVNPVGTAFLEHRNFISKLREVGAQYRWSDPNAHKREAGSGKRKGGRGGDDGGGALIPVSILIEGGGGKWETVRLTGPPAEIVWPAAGIWRITEFSGCSELVSRDIPGILSPSCSIIDRASPALRPNRSGICTVAGPLLSTASTLPGSSLFVPAGGLVAITSPRGGSA